MQQAEQDGLTVDEYQRKLDKAQLGNVDVDVQTMYSPSNGVSANDPLGIGKPSHEIVTPLFSDQGASVVGPKGAFVLPPGVVPDTANPPIATRKDQMEAVENAFPPGTDIRPPQQLPPEFDPNRAPVPGGSGSSPDSGGNSSGGGDAIGGGDYGG